jgi:hypothetical protein
MRNLHEAYKILLTVDAYKEKSPRGNGVKPFPPRGKRESGFGIKLRINIFNFFNCIKSFNKNKRWAKLSNIYSF